MILPYQNVNVFLWFAKFCFLKKFNLTDSINSRILKHIHRKAGFDIFFRKQAKNRKPHLAGRAFWTTVTFELIF